MSLRVLVAEALVVSHVLPVMGEAWWRGGGGGTSPASTAHPTPRPGTQPVSQSEAVEGRDEVCL